MWGFDVNHVVEFAGLVAVFRRLLVKTQMFIKCVLFNKLTLWLFILVSHLGKNVFP